MIVCPSAGSLWEHKQKKEIASWQIRKQEIDEAIAKHTIPRVRVDPSGMIASVTTTAPRPHEDPDEDCVSMPSLTDSSSDGSGTDIHLSGQSSDSGI